MFLANQRQSFARDHTDPLTHHFLTPPASETPEQRAQRESQQASASKRSREIDEWLRAEKAAKEKDRRKRKVQIILVGQSESGKSTTLRNFQLQYAPQAFRAERATWKTVIQLNVIRSVRRMHKALSSLEDALVESPIRPWSSVVSNKPASVRLPGVSEDVFEYHHSQRHGNSSRPTLTPNHRLLLMRLCPLLALEPTLVRQLTGNDPPPTIYSAPKFAGITMGGFFAPTAAVRNVKPSWWGKEVPDEDLPPISTGEPDAFYSHPSTRTSGGSRTTLHRPAASPGPPSAFADAPFAPQMHDELSIQASSWNQRIGHYVPPLSTRPSNGSLTNPQTASLTSGDSARPRRSSVSSQSPPFNSQSTTPPLSRAPSVASFASTNSAGTSSGKSKSAFKLPNLSMSMAIRRVRSSNSLKDGSLNSGNWKDSVNTKGSESADLVMSACAADIAELWRDTEVRLLLDRVFGIRVEAEAGFFLDDIARVAAWDYVPTDEDVLRARLKTLGISEHRFVIESQEIRDAAFVNEMIVYDVGGSRTQRHQWMSYFEDVNAIIFLAPLSAFDQRLVEDPSVNRIQDSLNLWKTVSLSPLLQQADFILFLNKCDLLKRKLEAGVRIRDYISRFQGDDQTVEGVTRFFKAVFTQTWQRATIQLGLQPVTGRRALHVHSTSVIDAQGTRDVLLNVQDCILRANLKTVGVL